MSAHTPGPWTITRCGTGHFDVHTASLNGAGDYAALAYSEPDARLIAAAPDMYEALCEMIAHRDELKLSDYPAIVRARAALAKATGEQS